MIGLVGHVEAAIDPTSNRPGKIFVRGEYWNAEADRSDCGGGVGRDRGGRGPDAAGAADSKRGLRRALAPLRGGRREEGVVWAF